MINESLKALYAEKIKGLSGSISFSEKVDGPILMNCWEEHYNASDFKVLFVGQECNGWIGYMDDKIEVSIDGYKNFQFSKNGNSTVFWQYVHKINNSLNPDQKGNKNFLWTNVSKFCTLDGKGLDWTLHRSTVEKFNCLEEEIEIIKPDVVFFFSGPNYDDKINLQFDGKLNFTPAFKDTPVRQIARVEHEVLPFHAYRTYHPSYLQRSESFNLVERIIAEIKKEKITS